MSRGPTKAQLILQEARNRLEIAKRGVREAQDKVTIAQATLFAHQEAYDALEMALARKSSKSQSAAPGAGKRSSSKRGVETGSTPNTGEQPENALAATGD